ncbi:MAG: S8 family serine peptidase [Bacteroidota bacterium]
MKYILTIIFLFSSLIYSQQSTKYLVYFKDKGITKSNTLSKTSQEYITALDGLSPRSIERRKKVIGDNIVEYNDVPIKIEYVETIEKTSAKIVWKLKWFNAVSCWATEKQFAEIQKLSFVDKIEKIKTIRYRKTEENDNRMSKVQVDSDSTYELDYGFSLTQNELSDIPTVHDLGYSGRNVIVGLLDAGFAWREHPSLSNANVLAEYDFVYGDSLTDDGDASHGTSVFSIIGGFHESWLIGPAYNAQYILAKTEDIFSETRVEEDNFAAALEWMEALGVDITSSSLGYSEFDDTTESYTYKDMDGKTTIVTKASEIAFSKGVLTISSAGNEGNKSWKYITAPADGFNTLAIGAVNASNEIAAFSSHGPTYDNRMKPEILAQGVSCYNARAYSEGYGFGSGTSFSAPIASGIAAQLLSTYPHLNNNQMRRIIIEAGDNADKPDVKEYKRGYGLLSAVRALEYPNLKEENGNYILNKMFINEIIGDEDSVFAAIYDPKTDVVPFSLMQENNGYYSIDVPSYQPGTELMLQFMIGNRGGNNEFYRFIYGSLDIVKATDKVIPTQYEVYQNYPNPFNSSTTIVIDLPQPTNFKLKVYNILGQEIKTIYSGSKLQGQHKFFWNGNDNFGSRVSSGVYIYNLYSEGMKVSRKMILLN